MYNAHNSFLDNTILKKNILMNNIELGWLVVLFYGISTLSGTLNAELNYQKIQSSISIVFVYKQLNVKIILFQTIQFSISTQLSSI